MSARVCVCVRKCEWANEFYKHACFSGLEEVSVCVCFLSLECVHSVEGLIYASSTVCACPSVE